MSSVEKLSHPHLNRVTARTHSPLPPAQIMPLLINLPLPVMFTRWGIFAGVTGVEIFEGTTWDHVDSRRRISQTNGGSMVETITRYEAGSGFTYHSTDFDRAFEPIATTVDDDWAFNPAGTGTDVLWTWTFHATTHRQWLLGIALRPLWQTYMRRILSKNIAILSNR